MSRINTLFKHKNKNILSVYCMAGYPQADSLEEVVTALAAAGADMIEIGIPFSDPLADGPVIQQSATQALANGMTLAGLLKQLPAIRSKVAVPLILMGYLNSILQYGVDRFMQDAADCGVDGLIIPDLPLEEYRLEYRPVMEMNNLKMIFLIGPHTPEERICELDACSDAFLYMVTAAATTGQQRGSTPEQLNYFKRIGSMQLQNPVLGGFGISDRDGFETLCRYVNGGIIGSRFLECIGQSEGSLTSSITHFIQTIRL